MFIGPESHGCSLFPVQGVVPSENLADTYEKKEQVLSETELDDVVQGVEAVLLHPYKLTPCLFPSLSVW